MNSNTGGGLTAREAAFRALGAYRRADARPDAALGELIDGSSMSAADSALATQLVNGVLQNMAYCDYVASVYSSRKINGLEPRVLDILRISIYQLIFLTKIPHSAAVNEGVTLAKKHTNPQAAGFINAVLRTTAQAAADGRLPEAVGEDDFQRLSIKHSHPEWLVRELCGILGHAAAESVMEINNGVAPVTAQVNTLLADADTVMALLDNDGAVAQRHSFLENCFELRGQGDIRRLSVFRNGYFYVQDAASRLAVIAAGPAPGDLVIDGCAAPGGKSFAAAIMMKNAGCIKSFDISDKKVTQINDGAKRLGIEIICAEVRDVAAPDEDYLGKADVVFADVPCSGFGVIRKSPEIRYKAEGEIAGLPDIQKKILSNLSSYVRPGGTLLYSTCSILKRENEQVIEAFLLEHKGFKPDGYSLPGIGQIPGGMLTLWPHIHGTDGFFICKMKRIGNSEFGIRNCNYVL